MTPKQADAYRKALDSVLNEIIARYYASSILPEIHLMPGFDAENNGYSVQAKAVIVETHEITDEFMFPD